MERYKKIIPMGLDDIPEPFRKYSEYEHGPKKTGVTGDMLFMLLVMLILFE